MVAIKSILFLMKTSPEKERRMPKPNNGRCDANTTRLSQSTMMPNAFNTCPNQNYVQIPQNKSGKMLWCILFKEVGLENLKFVWERPLKLNIYFQVLVVYKVSNILNSQYPTWKLLASFTMNIPTNSTNIMRLLFKLCYL
jgi:hypothetical protein